MQCSVKSERRFDTFGDEDDSQVNELVDYLRVMPHGALVVGVSGDEPRSGLGPALSSLKAVRIIVDDVHEWGSFAFAMQVGYP